MKTRIDPGRATRPQSLNPPLPSQDVSKYQATNPTVWEPEPTAPIPWRAVAFAAATVTVACVALFASRDVQFVVASAIALGAFLYAARKL